LKVKFAPGRLPLSVRARSRQRSSAGGSPVRAPEAQRVVPELMIMLEARMIGDDTHHSERYPRVMRSAGAVRQPTRDAVACTPEWGRLMVNLNEPAPETLREPLQVSLNS
jgi:hypothetical protein